MTEIERVLAKIDNLTDAVSGLVTAIAVKEEKDRHLEQEVMELGAKHVNIENRVGDLEKVAAGNNAILDIQKMFWKSAIGFVVVTIGAGVVWAIVQMKGG